MTVLIQFCVIPKRGVFTSRARDLVWIVASPVMVQR
jgi:hypothetical protein